MNGAERLAYMADQIARNLAVRGETAAARETADHIASFWDPAMRATLLGMDAAALSPIAARAVALLREGAARPTAPAAGPAGGSDAG